MSLSDIDECEEETHNCDMNAFCVAAIPACAMMATQEMDTMEHVKVHLHLLKKF